MRISVILLLLTTCISCLTKRVDNYLNDYVLKDNYDSHVHIMSPELIEHWKELGISFSKPGSYYSNIDTILANNEARFIDLIGMGYIYGNPEYYKGDDAYQKMMNENNYLFESAKKYPNRIRPFFAIDPLKEHAIDEIERCYTANSKSGLKLHFSASQVYLTEPTHLHKVRTVFKKAAAYELPILLHFDNWHPKFGKPDLEILVDSVLSQIDPIQLSIAHFGTSGGFNEKTKAFITAFEQIRNRIPKRHHIYLDISAVALDKDSEGVYQLSDEEFKILKIYIRKIGIETILFGTDYPLYKAKEYKVILFQKVGLNKDEFQTIQNNTKEWMDKY